jgi:hypothetical protein
MSNSNNDKCISYELNALEFILPSPIVFSTLCLSTDKTSLFIMSLIRLIFYIIFYYLLAEMIDMNEHKTIQYILFTLICINIIYLGMVVSKNTMYSISSNQSMLQTVQSLNQ